MADRGVERFADSPRLAVTLLLPVGRRHDPAGLSGQRQVEFLTKPEPLRHGSDSINSYLAAEGVEIDIAALGQRTLHVDKAMAAPGMAVPGVVAQSIAAVAVDALVGGDAGLQCGKGGHHFEG